MATLRFGHRITLAAALTGCGDLRGLATEQLPPLASVHVRVTGDLDAVREPTPEPPRLRVTLVWGAPLLPDASCLPPMESAEHAAVAANGCGDPLGFHRGGFEPAQDVPVEPDGTATIDMYSLPELLFGDTFSQIVYGSLVVYDDRDGTGALEGFSDVRYGASFASMARPDTRVAFRHGGFDERWAYYPRRGCEPPVPGYSIVSAGGFTLEQAIEAQARGELPMQDPARCRREAIDHEVAVELRPPEELVEIDCPVIPAQFLSPPPTPFPGEVITACTSIPDRGTGRAHGRSQLLIAPAQKRDCKFMTHYVLRGCYADALCERPEWDIAPPAWWPCPPEDRP